MPLARFWKLFSTCCTIFNSKLCCLGELRFVHTLQVLQTAISYSKFSATTSLLAPQGASERLSLPFSFASHMSALVSSYISNTTGLPHPWFLCGQYSTDTFTMPMPYRTVLPRGHRAYRGELPAVVVNYCSHAPTEAQVRTQPRVWSWELQATKKQSQHRCKMPPGAEYLTGFPHLGHPRSSPHPHPDLCLAMHMPCVPSKGRTVQRQPQCLQEHSLIPSLLPHKMFERFSQDQLVTTLDIRLVSQYNKPSFRVPVIELKLPCIRWQRR